MVTELGSFDNKYVRLRQTDKKSYKLRRLLLHTETLHSSTVPVWSDVRAEDVDVLKDIMTNRNNVNGAKLEYARIPVTAEKPPDFGDIRELMEIVVRHGPHTPIVVNCQLGRGRSTMTSV